MKTTANKHFLELLLATKTILIYLRNVCNVSCIVLWREFIFVVTFLLNLFSMTFISCSYIRVRHYILIVIVSELLQCTLKSCQNPNNKIDKLNLMSKVCIIIYQNDFTKCNMKCNISVSARQSAGRWRSGPTSLGRSILSGTYFTFIIFKIIPRSLVNCF